LCLGICTFGAILFIVIPGIFILPRVYFL
jgi:hypothetical protein